MQEYSIYYFLFLLIFIIIIFISPETHSSYFSSLSIFFYKQAFGILENNHEYKKKNLITIIESMKLQEKSQKLKQ